METDTKPVSDRLHICLHFLAHQLPASFSTSSTTNLIHKQHMNISTRYFLHLSNIHMTKLLKYLTFLSSSSSRFFASALCASNFFAVATSVSSSLCNVTISEPRVFISNSFCCFSCSSLEWSLHRHQQSNISTKSITATLYSELKCLLRSFQL